MYNKDDIVKTPLGNGKIFEVWNIGDFPPLYDDSGKEVTERCYAIYYTSYSWQWFKESEIKEV